MNRVDRWAFGLSLAAALVVSGCSLYRFEREPVFQGAGDANDYAAVATEIEYPDVDAPVSEAQHTPPPLTLDDPRQIEYWDLDLQNAVHLALANSTALRDLGGLILQSPEAMSTVQDPAIVETDPRFGVDAALSAFDASFTANAFFEKNDRQINNEFFGGGTRTLKQDLASFEFALSKRTATGSQFTLRKLIDYDFNNAPGNAFPSVWTVFLDAESRHLGMQGSGVESTRIAGPDPTPGSANGVLIARVNTDINVAQFETGVRNLVSDVENAYWELYFAYRDLDAKISARNRALETWRRIHALYETGRRGGEAEKEAQAREQYYRLEEEVQTALGGTVIEKTRSNTFRGVGGVQANERRLRLIAGLPLSDGRLIRPSTEPTMARVTFDWDEVLFEAVRRRSELRRQQWVIKRGELELIAARNFLLPQLDAVGRYRWRGFGRDLLDPDREPTQFDNAYADLLSGDFQEWQLGVEMELPIGFRQGHAAVRNAELRLARERAILEEQEREVTHDLSSAWADKERAYTVAQTNYNRRLAARQQLAALEAVYEDADENEKARLLDLLLDAQRRLADAESRFYRSLVEYTLSIKQVHYQKGSLLDYNGVYLAEGAWPDKAYADASQREHLRREPWKLSDYLLHQVPDVSRGSHPPDVVPGDALDYDAHPHGMGGYHSLPPGGFDRVDPPQPGGNGPAAVGDVYFHEAARTRLPAQNQGGPVPQTDNHRPWYEPAAPSTGGPQSPYDASAPPTGGQPLPYGASAPLTGGQQGNRDAAAPSYGRPDAAAATQSPAPDGGLIGAASQHGTSLIGVDAMPAGGFDSTAPLGTTRVSTRPAAAPR